MLNFLRFSRKIPTDEIFEHCLGFLTVKSKQNIWELALKMGRRFKIDDVKETAEYYNNYTYSLDESLKELFNHKRLRPFFCKELPALLESVYARRTPPLNQGLPRRLDSIARTFSLKENEKELLFLLMLIETDEFVENIYRELCSSTYINCSSSKTVKNKPFSILLGFTSHQVVSALSSNGALTRIGLIDENHDPGAEIVQFLTGLFEQLPLPRPSGLPANGRSFRFAYNCG